MIATVMLCVPPALAAQSEGPQLQPGMGGAGAQQPQDEMQQKQQELMRLSQEINVIERKAKATELVQAKIADLQETMADEIVRQAPALEEPVARQSELLEELTTPGAGDMDAAERQEKVAEYQQIRQQIEPVEQQVQQVEAVVAARDAYYDALTSEMRKIEPQTDDLLNRYREISNEIEQMTGPS